MNDIERRTEASMPVQSRIDLRTLAELLGYWQSKGYIIDSMSRLVSWSLDVLKELLRMNEATPRQIETLEEAYHILRNGGLLQKSMKKRMETKLLAARGLESIRMDGWEVDTNLKQFKEMHKGGTVIPGPETVASDDVFKSTFGKTKEEIREIDRKMHLRRIMGERGEDPSVVNTERNLEKMEAADKAIEEMP